MFISLKRQRGFTLIEVTTAMAILTLVAGSVYGVLRGTIEVAAGLEQARREQQQMDGLFELCRRTFRSFPADAILEGRFKQQGGKAFPEVLIRRAPELLAWDQVTDFEAVSILALRPQVGGLYSLSLLRVTQPKDQLEDPTARSKDGDWLKLVTDLAKLEWRYFDPRSNLWLDELPIGGIRPTAVELKIWSGAEKNPTTAVFWVVPLVPQVASSTTPPPTPPPPGGTP